MNVFKSLFTSIPPILILLFLMSNVNAIDREEGGYAGQKGQGHDMVIYNFLKHFNYEQYYWGYKHQWSTNNNNRVDAMDFAIFAGHANRWLIALLDGNVSLVSAGSSQGIWKSRRRVCGV